MSNRATTISSSSTSTTIDNSSSLMLKCVYCQNNLGKISIICSKCYDFNLCLKCYSMSAEIGDHKKDHDYKIRTLNNYFPIFDNEKVWSFKEENYLLNYIEQYGFANWDEISKQFDNFEQKRTSNECMQHYYAYYIYGNIGKYTLNNEKTSQDKLNVDHTKDSDITVLLPPIEMSVEEQRALGYMPLRDDFEREYKNDAENLLSNLTINNDDDETEIDLKVALTKIYREVLLDRQRLKKIAREYGLINNASALINKQRNDFEMALNGNVNQQNLNNVENVGHGSKKRRRDDESNSFNGSSSSNGGCIGNNTINEKFKKFAQLCSVSFYETFMENVRKRNQLINRIEELNKYRELGIKTFKELDVYKETLKVKKEDLKESKKLTRRLTTSSLTTTPVKKQLKLDSSVNFNENTRLNDTDDYNNQSMITHANQSANNNNNTNNISCASSTSSSNSNNENSNASSIISSVSNYSGSVGSLDHNNLINRNGRTERLCSMPGYNLLSENEKKLISSLNLKPTLYITFKTFLIKNSIVRQKAKSSLIEKKSLNGDTTTNGNSNGASMLLRRHSTAGGSSKATSGGKLLNGKSLMLKRLNNNKLLSSCPNYFQIPHTTRRRIFRFLCDNGWIKT